MQLGRQPGAGQQPVGAGLGHGEALGGRRAEQGPGGGGQRRPEQHDGPQQGEQGRRDRRPAEQVPALPESPDDGHDGGRELGGEHPQRHAQAQPEQDPGAVGPAPRRLHADAVVPREDQRPDLDALAAPDGGHAGEQDQDGQRREVLATERAQRGVGQARPHEGAGGREPGGDRQVQRPGPRRPGRNRSGQPAHGPILPSCAPRHLPLRRETRGTAGGGGDPPAAARVGA